MLGIMDSGELALIEISSGFAQAGNGKQAAGGGPTPVRDQMDRLARTKRTCGDVRYSVAVEGKADLSRWALNRRE